MTTQPEALRLAALLDINHYEPHVEQAAAAELRRLHAEVEALRATQVEPAINWQPLSTAPDGVRVLLGPRDNPVIGIVWQPEYWADDQSPAASVVHYNGNILVSDYRCAEWAPLPCAALTTTQPAVESATDAVQRYCTGNDPAMKAVAAFVAPHIAQPAPVGEYPELLMQYACSGYFPVYSSDKMRAYADATHTHQRSKP